MTPPALPGRRRGAMSTARMRAAMLATLVAMLCAVLGVVHRAWVADGLRWVDRAWLGERLMDGLARWRGLEDWTQAAPLREDQDYRWTDGGRPLRIAHALGESGQSGSNTIAAMRAAHADGMRLLEVDLVLDGTTLRCQHDPGPRPLAPDADGCTLERLLDALPDDAWLVLDLKTEFDAAGARALDVARRAGRLDRLVFQLYAPSQVTRFARWQAAEPVLPGPILTTYLAHRSLAHILANARRLHIRAIALPLSRLPALPDDRRGALVLVHPVHDCAVVDGVRVDGHYTLRSLHCGPPAPSLSRSR